MFQMCASFLMASWGTKKKMEPIAPPPPTQGGEFGSDGWVSHEGNERKHGLIGLPITGQAMIELWGPIYTIYNRIVDRYAANASCVI